MITTAIHDQFLVIGKDILSQYWSQKHIQANYFVDKNLFRYVCVSSIRIASINVFDLKVINIHMNM